MQLKPSDCTDSAEYQARSTRSGRIFYVTFCDGIGWDAEGTPWRPGSWPELTVGLSQFPTDVPYYNSSVEFYFPGTLV
jgi:hypothetical protein